jgi:hypothetical protein
MPPRVPDYSGEVHGSQVVVWRVANGPEGRPLFLLWCMACERTSVKRRRGKSFGRSFGRCVCEVGAIVGASNRKRCGKSRTGETHGYLTWMRLATEEEAQDYLATHPGRPHGALALWSCEAAGDECCGDTGCIKPYHAVRFGENQNCGCLRRKMLREMASARVANGTLFRRGTQKVSTKPSSAVAVITEAAAAVPKEKKKRKRPAAERHQLWKDLKDRGRSYGQIAKQFSTTTEAVKQALRRLGVGTLS